MWILDRLGEKEQLSDLLLFSDEGTFHNDSLFSRQNFYYYSDENQHTSPTTDH